MVRKDQKEIKFVKRQNSEHPYCTNWPMSMEENEIEICISCGKETNHKKGDDVTHRHNYIEGAGQLCLECGRRNNKEAEHAQKLWKSIID
jgi:DNA-directed RNA polymerase subunit RPC12/RpoP